MIRQSVVDRLASANQRLQAALVAGEGTLPHRTVIARLEADLVQLDADAQHAKSAAIAKSANDQGELAASIAQSANAGIAAILARHPVLTHQPLLPDTMTNQAIISAAKVLADAETKYEAAAQIYGESGNRIFDIKSRLSDLGTSGVSILEQRRSGQLAEREAAGLIALNYEDKEDLSKLLTVAENEQGALPSFEPVQQAQAAFDSAVKIATFDALAQRAKETEAAFLAIVADVYAAGRSIGRSSMLGASWVPSKALGYMITSGQPPECRHAS